MATPSSRSILVLLSAAMLFACARGEPAPVAGPGAPPASTTVVDAASGHSGTAMHSSASGPPARALRPSRPARPGSTPAAGPSLSPEAEAWVGAHNLHRARVSPAASPALPPVAWSETLAADAARWAARCEFDHSSGDHGENLAARTHGASPDAILASWAAEAEHFDYGKNRCQAGQVCGHYTQVVWRDSTQIGCATARCGVNSPFGGGEWYLSVCNYSPSGNWQGKRPY